MNEGIELVFVEEVGLHAKPGEFHIEIEEFVNNMNKIIEQRGYLTRDELALELEKVCDSCVVVGELTDRRSDNDDCLLVCEVRPTTFSGLSEPVNMTVICRKKDTCEFCETYEFYKNYAKKLKAEHGLEIRFSAVLGIDGYRNDIHRMSHRDGEHKLVFCPTCGKKLVEEV